MQSVGVQAEEHSIKEQYLLSDVYKDDVGSRRHAWHIITRPDSERSGSTFT